MDLINTIDKVQQAHKPIDEIIKTIRIPIKNFFLISIPPLNNYNMRIVIQY